MRTKLLALTFFLYCSQLFAGELATTVTSTVSSGSVAARAKQVTFVFSTDFNGTIGGVCFAGTAGVCTTGSPADGSFTVRPPAGDVLASIAFTVGTGTLRIIRVN